MASSRSIPRLFSHVAAILGICGAWASPCHAQSSSLYFSLNSQALPGYVSLNVVLAAAPGAQPAAIQWSTSYPTAVVMGFVATAGPSATAASKSVACAANQCLLYGQDSQTIPNGVVAVLTFLLAGNPPGEVEIDLTSAMSASPSGNALPAGQLGSLSVALQPLTLVPSVVAGFSLAGSAAQVVSFGGWDTTFQLINTGASSSSGRVELFQNTGDSLALPFVEQNTTPPTGFLASSVDQTLPPGGAFAVDTSAYDTQATRFASAQLFTGGNVGGFLRFRYGPTGQEASVPLEMRNENAYVVGFDQTQGASTGIALANLASTPANVPVVIRDQSGALIGSTNLFLPPNGNAAFAIAGQFATTANIAGTLQFMTPSGGRISVVGSRSAQNGGFTILPAFTLADLGSGKAVQASAAFLPGGGGWTSTIQLVNLGTTQATAHLHFFDPNGADLSFPVAYSGTTANAATLDPVLPPNSTLSIQCPDLNGSSLQSGSVQITADGPVTGFVRYRYDPSGQETSVPLETRNAAAYVVPFDSTGGLATGVVLANLGSASVTVTALIRDTNGSQLGSESIAVPANGNSVFVLGDRFAEAANQSGTVQFSTPNAGQISVLGLRFPPSGNFSSIPVLKP